MFETLFTYPRVLRRHREGPLTEERAAYLSELAAQCVAPATLIKQARCCLRVAVELERWPADHCFDNDEVREMASRYAAQCRAASSRNASEHFRATAVDLLRRLGRLRLERTGLPNRYEAMLCEFIALQHERSWLSDVTCQSARWQITKFLDYLEQRGLVLETIHPADVDAFYQHMALRWSRRSLKRARSRRFCHSTNPHLSQYRIRHWVRRRLVNTKSCVENGSIARASCTRVTSPVICFLKSTGSTHSHTSMPSLAGRIMATGSHTRAPWHRPCPQRARAPRRRRRWAGAHETPRRQG